jgi:hypothetical protein
MFQFGRFAHPYGCLRGCPIRKSSDQRFCAAPRSLSQLYTSFIASLCQGIHRVPLLSFFSEQAPCPRSHPDIHIPRQTKDHSAPPSPTFSSTTDFITSKNHSCTANPCRPHYPHPSFPTSVLSAPCRVPLALLRVELVGVEPTTSCLQGRRSSQLSYSPNRWAWKELNLRPHAYQACALTT